MSSAKPGARRWSHNEQGPGGPPGAAQAQQINRYLQQHSVIHTMKGFSKGKGVPKGHLAAQDARKEGASEPRCEGWPDRVCILTLSPGPPREVCKPCSFNCGPHGSSIRVCRELSGNVELWPHPNPLHQNQYFNKLPWESTFMVEKCWSGYFSRTQRARESCGRGGVTLLND